MHRCHGQGNRERPRPGVRHPDLSFTGDVLYGTIHRESLMNSTALPLTNSLGVAAPGLRPAPAGTYVFLPELRSRTGPLGSGSLQVFESRASTSLMVGIRESHAAKPEGVYR